MNLKIFRGILFLFFCLIFVGVNAQPLKYDYISYNTTDTVWASHTYPEDHASDYYLYCWWKINNWVWSREYRYNKALVVKNDGSVFQSSWNSANTLSRLLTPGIIGIGPIVNNGSFKIMEHGFNKTIFGIVTKDYVTYRLEKSFDTIRYAKILPPLKLKATNNGQADYVIDLTWEKGTDIPDNQHKYIVYKNGLQIATVAGTSRTYSDKTIPGTYLYGVKTLWESADTNLVSVSDTEKANTFLLNLTCKYINQQINFSWKSLDNIKGRTDSTNLKKYILYRRDTMDIKTPEATIQTIYKEPRDDSYSIQINDEGLIPGYKYRYILKPFPEDNYYPDTLFWKTPSNGGFTGIIQSLSGVGVPGVEVCAIRLDTVPQDTTSQYCTISDSKGNFTIDEIYYFTKSDFKLQPRYKNHGFKMSEHPDCTKGAFTLTDGGIGGITFTDTTSVSAHGKIIQPGFSNSCELRLEGSKVKLYRDNLFVTETTTDQDGEYFFDIDSLGKYTIVPELYNHQFVPDSFPFSVFGDTTITTISDTTRYNLSGYVYGACDQYFGKAGLTIHNTCIDTTIYTNSNGYYEILLPANSYTISIESFNSELPVINSEDVVNYFTSEQVNLTKESVSFDFTYRFTPDMAITGLNITGCGLYEDIPIVKQNYTYPITIQVFDVFMDTCSAKKGFIEIKDKTGDSDIDTIMAFDSGKLVYKMKPGIPNMVADYTKNFSATAILESENKTKSIDILVEGYTPFKNSFLTTSPELPLFILHDPPGDNSYSYLEKDSTTNIVFKNFSRKIENEAGRTDEEKVCPSVDLTWDLGKIELTTNVTGGWKRLVSLTKDNITEENNISIIEMTHKQGYKTSEDPELTSSSGDVFIGGALNLIYSEINITSFDNNACIVNNKRDITILPHSLATDFIYSEHYIRNSLIPRLNELQLFYEPTDKDTASYFEDQKNIWFTALANNQKNLSDSSTFLGCLSFDGGSGAISNQVTRSSSSTNHFEFSAVFDTSVVRTWGGEFAGLGGWTSKVKKKVTVETGTQYDTLHTGSQTVGYVIDDDDTDDAFMVNVYTDNVYGTPAFKLVTGETSCPYEANTRPREGVQLTANKYLAYVDAPDGQAVFQLQLSNLSQTSERRNYNLFFHQGSNPDAAQLTLGGSEIQADPIPYTLNSWGSSEATVTVKRGPEAFDYNGLMFTLESGCGDDQIIDTLLLDVHFKSICSNLFISNPAKEWTLTSADNGILPVTLGGYNRDLLNIVTIQICPENDEDGWTSLEYLNVSDLDPEQTHVNLILDKVEEGNYKIRARLECSSGKLYTEYISGIKDTYGPGSFGVPEPADNKLDDGDIISVLFNETINTKAFSTASIKCINTSDSTEIACNAGCNLNQITIYPEFPDEVNSDDVYTVFVFGLEDLYGNMMDDTVTFSFTVNAIPEFNVNADTDGDGILNGIDNCPYTSNSDQKDSDNDFIGDVCDTDMDDDDIVNMKDNCQYIENTGQEDLDDDKIGDNCDDDDDGDMVPDLEDSNPRVYNPDQTVSIINQMDNPVKVQLQPNPASKIVRVIFDGLFAGGEIGYSIVDMQGKQISSGNAYIDENPEFSINIENIRDGMYILVLKNVDKNLIHIKLMVTK